MPTLLYILTLMQSPQTFTFAHWVVVARVIGGAFFAIALSGPAIAQTTIFSAPLTLESALREAETRSYALKAQDAATKSAHEMAVAVGRLPDPVLRLSVDNLPVEGSQSFSLTADFMTMRSVGLSQTLTRKAKRQARSTRFEREADTAQAKRIEQLSELRRQTALAWFDRFYLEKMLELLTRKRDEMTLQIEASAGAYRSALGSQADIFTARLVVANVDDQIIETRARAANANSRLSRWVGELASAPLGSAPRITRTHFSATTLTNLLDDYPAIGLLSSKRNIAQAEVDIAKQNKQADWSISLMYSDRGSPFSNMLSVGVSIPLYWDQKHRQDRELAAKLAKVEQIETEREEIKRAYLERTQAWLVTWQSNLERLRQYDKTLIVLAGERTRAALAGYRGGKLPLMGVLDSRKKEIDTQMDRLRIEMQTATLWANLEFLIPETVNPVAQHVSQQSVQSQ